MKALLLAFALLGVSCQLSPNIVAPDPSDGGGRYADCRRAARDYCRQSLQVVDDEMKACVARATYECTSGGGD